MKTKICPRYDGSVIDSGYPTSDVVNTASPLIFVFAPKLLPWKIGPFLIVKVARSYDGLVERGDVAVGGTLGVPSKTVALKRAWKRGLKMLLVRPAATGLTPEGLTRIRGNIAVAIFRLKSSDIWGGGDSVYRRFPKVVGDVVYEETCQ